MKIKNKNFKILDCTIRDGGYYNNWDFDDELIDVYLKSINKLPIDYIEIGYRSPKKTEYFGKYFYCPVSIIKILKEETDKKFAIMLNQKDININHVEKILIGCVGLVELVRIAVNPDNFHESLKLAMEIKKMNFKVGFNVMYMSKWIENEDFYLNFSGIEKKIDFLYLVDSYGSVFPNDVRNAISKIKKCTNVKLGFHGHNNIELAFSNTLMAIDCGIDIVDSTFTGMGRGAGNMKTELLLSYLNSLGIIEFDYNHLSNLVSRLESLRDVYRWGTNLPYMISGLNSISQKFVMDLYNNNFLDSESVINILNNNLSNFKYNLPNIDIQNRFKNSIIIGGGNMLSKIISDIKRLIINNKEISLIFSSPTHFDKFNDIDVEKYVCLIGIDSKKIKETNINLSKTNFITFSSKFNMPTIIPEFIQERSFEIEELLDKNLPVNSTNICCYIASKITDDDVYIVGYDGYIEENIGNKERKLIDDNNLIFKNIQDKYPDKYKFLYPTKYDYIKTESIYSII